jgi:superfamily I DNA/RNA helicase
LKPAPPRRKSLSSSNPIRTGTSQMRLSERLSYLASTSIFPGATEGPRRMRYRTSSLGSFFRYRSPKAVWTILRSEPCFNLKTTGLEQLGSLGSATSRWNTGSAFTKYLNHIHLGSLAAESLDPVVDAGRALIGKAEQISPRPDEDFNAWLVRVADDLSVGTEIFEYLVQISREITGEVAELEMTIEEEEQGQAKPLAPVDFLGELLTAMAGAPDSAPSHLPGRVTFTTMHGAKGLSADVVFLLQAEHQVIPGTAAGPDFDEARRLLYVSMTRARKRLVITACYRRVGPQRFVGSEEMVTRSLTRFLVDYGLVAETLAEYLLHVGERSP